MVRNTVVTRLRPIVRRRSPSGRGAILAIVAVVLTAGSAGCGSSDDGAQAEAERQAAVEQRIERERKEAARDARQEERIKQLERELKSRTTGSSSAPSGSGGSSPTPATSSGSSSGGSSAPSAGGDWPGGSAYTVVLASETSESAARATQRRASDAGLDAGVLQSSNYSSLRSGYWVVFSGVYAGSGQAKERQTRARSLGFGDAYVRFVAP